MDPETFLDMANQVTKLKMYPYFDLAHSAACLLAIREEMGAGRSLRVTFGYNFTGLREPRTHSQRQTF